MERTRQELEAALAAAQRRADALVCTVLNAQGDASTAARAQHDAAEREAFELRRRLGTEFGAEVVVPLELGFDPPPEVLGVTFLQNELDAFLVFDTQPRGGGPAGVAVLRFRLPASSKFGLPNDEALEGHPLSERGLQAYRSSEVLNSSWLAEEQRRNAVRFPGYTLPCRHFVFTFHDCSLEILAQELDSELHPAGDHATLAGECLRRLGDSSP